jgi:glyoxylase-like metal-dependent hydrolase (beta-lactamase superfamily II)|tara:strand:- start:32 stop:970 length:939 start_codon:yes stop_codon:yes gene_type:complete
MIKVVRILIITTVYMYSQESADIDSRSVIESSWCENLPRAVYADLERIQVSNNWFEVYRLDHDVFAIYEPYQWQEVISYLILGRKKALLFDTGNGIGSIRDLVNELTTLPVVVINSHTHFDHMGGNSEFEDILAMDSDYTRRNMNGYGHDIVGEEVSDEAICSSLPNGIDPAVHRIPPFSPKKFIKGGHKIDLGGRVLKVLSTPGHTPDAVSLLDSELGLLWPGDNFYAGPIWLFFPETDLDAFYKSVDLLCGLVPRLKTMHPSHNSPIAHPKSLYKLKEAVSAVGKGSVSGIVLSGDRVEYVFNGFSLITR